MATDRALRYRSLFLFLLIAVSVIYLLPSAGVPLPGVLGRVFTNKVQLGLDLQGGLHIVYGVDLDKVVDDKAGEIRRDVEDRLKELELKGHVETPRLPIGSVYVVMDQAADKAKIDDKFLADYRDTLDTISCPADKADRTVCLRVTPSYANKIQEAAINQAIKTINERVDKFGIAEATIVKKGFDIIVELPGADKVAIERLKSIIDRTAQLEFKIVAENHEYTKQLMAHVGNDPAAAAAGITVGIDSWQNENTGQSYQDAYLKAKDATETLTPEAAKLEHCDKDANKKSEGGVITYECELSGRRVMERYLATLPANLQPPEGFQIGYEKVRPLRPSPIASKELEWRSYLLNRAAELTGTAISKADVSWDQVGKPEVLITFNRQGGRRFEDLTGRNVGKKMAIILDEEISSAPTIQTKIGGGRCTITMGGSDPDRISREAQDLVTVLRTGSLPAPLRQESESQVGATLGQDSIDRAQVSMVVGAALVILIMLYFYRWSGALANGAMMLNILFQVSILAMFQATLTLPGIAGLVLTVGMAVDSNIIIYERIREELRTGKTVKSAVDAGFGRAFWTVFDAHVTNFVAGFVLLEYGTGPIRGFAVMLLIGVVVNLFTSTWVSRLFFDLWLGRRKSVQALSI
jgi:preprotein translocase subunit SecD